WKMRQVASRRRRRASTRATTITTSGPTRGSARARRRPRRTRSGCATSQSCCPIKPRWNLCSVAWRRLGSPRTRSRRGCCCAIRRPTALCSRQQTDRARQQTRRVCLLGLPSAPFIPSALSAPLFRAEPQHRHEGFLRYFHLPDHLHALLALLLLFKQLALARDITTVALREHVLAQRLDVHPADDPLADRRLDRHDEHLLRDEVLQPAHKRLSLVIGL